MHVARPRTFAASAVAVAALSLLAGTSRASGKPEPVDCVPLARTWDAALEEAKLRNVPIVVHSHGFYCPPCWGLHGALMCNKKYMEFASENTVEVISLSRLEEGIEKEDRKAETYEAKVGGKTVKYLCEFPGLTAEDVIALNKSKAASFNTTGKTPFTCVVNPWTEETITSWEGGSASSSNVIDGVTEAKKALQKDHGKGLPGKDWKALVEAEASAAAKLEKQDYAAAIDALAKMDAKSAKWPDEAKARLSKARAGVVAAATEALDAVEKQKAEAPAEAKKQLTAIATKLRGTGLEQRAKDLLGAL